MAEYLLRFYFFFLLVNNNFHFTFIDFKFILVQSNINFLEIFNLIFHWIKIVISLFLQKFDLNSQLFVLPSIDINLCYFPIYKII